MSVTPSKDRPLVAAHRGASALAPELTVAAFQLALEMNADLIELDVQMTLDGEIVAFHDAAVDRTTGGSGTVASLTLRQLQTLDAGSWFNATHPEIASPAYRDQRIPTLREVIDLIAPRGTMLLIEIKHPEFHSSGFESRILEVVHQAGFNERATYLSFNLDSLVKVKNLDPYAKAALVSSKPARTAIREALSAGIGSVALVHTRMTAESALLVREQGLGLMVWTVDGEDEMKRVIALRPDIIITNRPDVLAAILNTR